MKSSGSPDLVALDRDLPTTPGDVLALRRARGMQAVSLDDYLSFLRQFGEASAEHLRSRRGPFGPSFELGTERHV